jgi:hypothetical protein
VKTIAVIPSNGRSFLEQCVSSLRDQVDQIVIVANGPLSSLSAQTMQDVIYVRDSQSDMNISRWWNIGIDCAESLAHPDSEWNTLVVNDDIIACHNLVETLSGEMRLNSSVLCYPNQWDNHRAFHRDPGPVDLHHRITGYCYMLRGEAKLRLDERFVWWYGDDDLDWNARRLGGSLLVPWCKVQHLAPNGSMMNHPELNIQAGKDRDTFYQKWGNTPW